MMGRGGFALLAVLWVMVGVAALGLAVSLAGREAVAAATNRINLARAAWLAEDCAERARAVVATVLAEEAARADEAMPGGWGRLDRLVPGAPLAAPAGCSVEMRPAGTTLDLNTASERALHRFLATHRIPPARSDSLVAALLDWRDADTVPRTGGAERGDYRLRGAPVPRDGPLADARELHRVRGWAAVAGADTLLGVEAGRICLNHAPLPVLAALPGFTEEVRARVAERRFRDLPLAELGSLAAELSPAARDSLFAHHSELAATSTLEPDAWLVVARGWSGAPAVQVVVEVRLVRAGVRAAVVRRRVWIS